MDTGNLSHDLTMQQILHGLASLDPKILPLVFQFLFFIFLDEVRFQLKTYDNEFIYSTINLLIKLYP